MSMTKYPEFLMNAFKDLVLKGVGTNFTLCMEHDVLTEFPAHYSGNSRPKDYSFHPRWNQPCQGGEMRKYKKTHGKECDKPESEKPNDLFHPFPAGNPVLVGVRFNYFKVKPEHEYILKFLFSPESPYRIGIGKPELLYENDKIVGVVLGDTKKIDPTVMVNLFQFMNFTFEGGLKAVDAICKNGATLPEALALLQLGGSQIMNTFCGTYEYYFAMKYSVQKFIDGEPNKLSNGNYFDRHDYDRKNVQDLFMEPDKNRAFIWYRDMADMVQTNGYSWRGNFIKDVLPVALERLRAKYQEQKSYTENQLNASEGLPVAKEAA